MLGPVRPGSEDDDRIVLTSKSYCDFVIDCQDLLFFLTRISYDVYYEQQESLPIRHSIPASSSSEKRLTTVRKNDRKNEKKAKTRNQSKSTKEVLIVRQTVPGAFSIEKYPNEFVRKYTR